MLTRKQWRCSCNRCFANWSDCWLMKPTLKLSHRGFRCMTSAQSIPLDKFRTNCQNKSNPSNVSFGNFSEGNPSEANKTGRVDYYTVSSSVTWCMDVWWLCLQLTIVSQADESVVCALSPSWPWPRCLLSSTPTHQCPQCTATVPSYL